MWCGPAGSGHPGVSRWAILPEDLRATVVQFVNAGYFLIATGAVLSALGFLSCYGAHTENKFISILHLIFTAEAAAAVATLVYIMAERFLTFLVVPNKTVYHSQKDSPGVDTNLKGLKCCGFNNYTDLEALPISY